MWWWCTNDIGVCWTRASDTIPQERSHSVSTWTQNRVPSKGNTNNNEPASKSHFWKKKLKLMDENNFFLREHRCAQWDQCRAVSRWWHSFSLMCLIVFFRMKSPAERRAEICEDFSPCRLLALRFGSQLAYQTYFSAQQHRPNPQLRPYWAPPPTQWNLFI